jgi:hypothetical protein
MSKMKTSAHDPDRIMQREVQAAIKAIRKMMETADRLQRDPVCSSKSVKPVMDWSLQAVNHLTTLNSIVDERAIDDLVNREVQKAIEDRLVSWNHGREKAGLPPSDKLPSHEMNRVAVETRAKTLKR